MVTYTDFIRFYMSGRRKWGIIGYSHGASIAYQFANRIEQEFPSSGINPPRLGFSGSIDGLRRYNHNHGPEPIFSETNLPPATFWHRNEYQRRDVRVRGNAVPGANVNLQVFTRDDGRHISHTTIQNQPSLHDRFRDQLIAKLQELPF